MHPDLARLVDLQRLASAIDVATRALAAHPQRLEAVDAALASARAAVDAAKTTLEAEKSERRALEKDLAAVSSRLDRYKDQLMAVKTNREFHAMQHEIAAAQESVAQFEERILVLMVQADDAEAALRTAEGRLEAAVKAAAVERGVLDAERTSLTGEITARQDERDAVAATLPENLRRLFDGIRAKRGVAVTRMVDGHCVECNVRVRPVVAGSIRRNDEIVQCDTCSRILYYVQPVGPDPSGTNSL